MSVLDAAASVLEDVGSPLGYREITRLALESGRWQTDGHTPEATVNAGISMDIVNHKVASRFQRTGKGIFALRKWGHPEYVRHSSNQSGQSSSPSASVPPPLPSNGSNVPVPQPLSFTDAAEQVLVIQGRPMHYRDITQRALDLGLLETAGKTPEATLYTQLLSDTVRRTRRGEPARFVQLGKGDFGLTSWDEHANVLTDLIDQHNAEVRKRFLERLHTMPPGEFEALIGRLLALLGFEEVEVTKQSGDGGIDVRGTLVVGDVVRIRMAVQVKRWRSNVKAPTVQQVRGALGTHEQGLIITTSDFSNGKVNGARNEALRPDAVPIGLMNGNQLVALLVEHGIGVHRTPYDLIELGDVEDVVEDVEE